jgi:hypothetical protein
MGNHEIPIIHPGWYYRLSVEEQKEVIAAAVRMFKAKYMK